MSVSIKKEFKSFPTQEQIELNRVITAAKADIAIVQAELVAVCAQLDTDGGVTETDYNTLTGGTLNLID